MACLCDGVLGRSGYTVGKKSGSMYCTMDENGSKVEKEITHHHKLTSDLSISSFEVNSIPT